MNLMNGLKKLFIIYYLNVCNCIMTFYHNFKVIILKSLLSLFNTITNKKQSEQFKYTDNAEEAYLIMSEMLTSKEPFMIARFGAFELNTVINYLGVIQKKKSVFKYIVGKQLQWWWNEKLFYYMQNNAGFFPSNESNIIKFCELMLEDVKEVDVLGSWLKKENFLNKELNYHKIHLRFIEPFWSERPWTEKLEGKKILVVHPFASLIKEQYKKRKVLFNNEKVLPKLKSLAVLEAVQSAGGQENNFKDWFEALNYMKREIDKFDYDICLVGAGAYGFPLAAYVKRSGKQAIHMGGSLQLLFGIRGNRWDNPNYGVKEWGIEEGSYSNLVNEHWVKPDHKFRPKNANQVEGACYW